jgi:hypothetical protein
VSVLPDTFLYFIGENSELEASQLTQISVIGTNSEPVLYADITSEGKLVFEFEFYRNEQFDFDYEFKHTVDQEEFPFIAARFGLRQDQPILSLIQQITDSGRGQELERALTLNEIKNELWTWVSY